LNGLNWTWITLELIAPVAVAMAIAFPIWLKRQPILGNLAGSAVIFSAAVALILRESVDLDRFARACLDAGFVCRADPSPFTRYAIYAFIALVEMMALFSVSLTVEGRLRRRGYDPEWR
jgi:hypothetical protein